MKLFDLIHKQREKVELNPPSQVEIRPEKIWRINEPSPDDRNRCIDCLYLHGDYCQIKIEQFNRKKYKPVTNILKRCGEFKLRKMTSEEINYLNKWLYSIGERDAECIETVFSACEESISKRNYYLTLSQYSK